MIDIPYKTIVVKRPVREELERCNIIVVLARLNDYFKAHHGYDRGLRGLSAEDFSMTVLEKVISGKRSWYNSKETDFIKFCTSVMCSEMNNFRNSIDYVNVINYDFNNARDRWDRDELKDEFEGF